MNMDVEATDNPSIQTLLLVDDDSGITQLIISHLDSSLWSIDTARSSDEALRLIKEATVPYTFAIVDMRLPENSNEDAQAYLGYQLVEKISRLSPDTKIIGMSQFIEGSSGFNASGHFFGFIEKIALIHNTRDVLDQCFSNAGAVITNKHVSLGEPYQPQRISWVLVSCLCGISASLLPLIFVYFNSELLRISLSLGIVVFLIVLLLNPRRRYLNAFWAVFGVWASSIVVPALGFQIDKPDFFVTFFSDGPEAIFFITSVLLMIVLLILDWKTG